MGSSPTSFEKSVPINCHGLFIGTRKVRASMDTKPQVAEKANTAYATTWCFFVWVRRLTKRQTAHLDRVTARINKMSLAYIAYIAPIGSTGADNEGNAGREFTPSLSEIFYLFDPE